MIPKEIQAIEETYLNMKDDEDDRDDEMVKDEKEEKVIKEAASGNMLVPKRGLHIQNSPYDEQSLINGKVCSIIVNTKSYANVALTTLLEKLKLPSSPNPQPYKL